MALSDIPRYTLTVTILLCVLFNEISAAVSNRKGKYLFDFIPESAPEADVQNDLSKSLPSSRNPTYNSPIYYIRLPPIPYSFVPGLGYVSQPNSASPSLVNLPVSFLGNGKPVTVYQWNGAVNPFATQPPTTTTPATPINRLSGEFMFNGKPNDIYLLRDSYNSLYDDALQHVYP